MWIVCLEVAKLKKLITPETSYQHIIHYFMILFWLSMDTFQAV